MNIFLAILLILAAIVLVISCICFCVKLRIRINIDKKVGEKLISKFTIEAPGGLFKKNLSGIKTKKYNKNQKQENSAQKSDYDSGIKQKINSYYRTFQKIKYIFSITKHKIRRSVYIEKLRLNVDFGLDDAAHTGIATGSLWAGIYNVIAGISKIAVLNEPDISITPDFENEKLAFNGECIIVLRLANIINILFVIGINYLTLKNKEKAAINYVNTD